MAEHWTWDSSACPGITSALADPDWHGRLERAGPEAVAGKILCVCAALAVGREVVGDSHADLPVADALDLLGCWIDDPTDDRFGRICDTIFRHGEQPELGPHGVVWWALRTATSSVGNGEAGWALGAVCRAAEQAGFGPDAVRATVWRELMARQKQIESDGMLSDGDS